MQRPNIQSYRAVSKLTDLEEKHEMHEVEAELILRLRHVVRLQ
jgi:hypothetical protein